MPFKNEKANKFSHEKIINNQFIKTKISDYKIYYDINDNYETKSYIESKFHLSNLEPNEDIDYIYSVDSSATEIPLNDEIPSAKIGLINFSSNIIDLNKKSEIYEKSFINPEKFNDIYNSNILTFICPTFNVVPKEDEGKDLIDVIRKEIYEFYANSKPFNSVSMLDSLFNVISCNNEIIKIKCTNNKCPSREFNDNNISFNLSDINTSIFKCPYCGKIMYLTDYLRLNEAIDLEFGQSSLLTRLSQVTEHLLAINLIDSLIKFKAFSLLKKTAFVIDGPLAIYGEPAKLNKSILSYIYKISTNIDCLLIYFGIMKTGKLKDHFTLIDKKISLVKNSYLLVDDKYRFKYIQKAPENNSYFGQEVLFGQDFLFYSEHNKKFVLSVLYPFDEKNSKNIEEAFDPNSYKNLFSIFNLINKISIDIYEDAILPIALSHKYASISLNPGSNILEKFICKNIYKK